MTKARLHPSLLEFHGAMGDMLFRQKNGKLYASIKSNGSSKEPTQAQAAQRERFRQAVAYGKFAMADAATREIYERASEQRDIPAFALCVADFLHPPAIDEIDASGYHGQAGGSIQIITSDDLGAVNVNVVLTNDDLGTVIESGQAIEYPVGTGHWTYTATSQAAAGTLIQFQVTVTDRPGGTAVQRGTKAV